MSSNQLQTTSKMVTFPAKAGLTWCAVPGDNNDNTVVAPASMATSSGGTVASASVAAFVDAARHCRVIGGKRG